MNYWWDFGDHTGESGSYTAHSYVIPGVYLAQVWAVNAYGNATYSATKAFVTSFTEAVHEELKGTGVAVTVLCPGFTRTGFQVTASAPAGDVPGFMWQEAPEVARAGLDALAGNRAVAIPGPVNKLLGGFSAVAPHAITRRIAAAVIKRSAD